MVRDSWSHAGECCSDLALLILTFRSEPSPHSPTDGCTLCTRSSLSATRVSWKHFTSSKTSHRHCRCKHGRCSTRQHLRQRAHSMPQRLVALAGSRGWEAHRQRTHTTCSRGRHQRQMARQDEGMASWSCLQLSTPHHDGLLLRRARCQLRSCSRWDSIPNRSQCFPQYTRMRQHQR